VFGSIQLPLRSEMMPLSALIWSQSIRNDKNLIIKLGMVNFQMSDKKKGQAILKSDIRL